MFARIWLALWWCDSFVCIFSTAYVEVLRKRTYVKLPPIDEELPINTFVGSISHHSTFPDYQYSKNAIYSFIPSKQTSYFYLDKKNGNIFTSVRFDRDTLCSEYINCCNIKHRLAHSILARGSKPKSNEDDRCVIDLKVQVEEANKSEVLTALVEINDINDNNPHFEKQHINLSIPENKPEGSLIQLPLAKDNDSRKFGIKGYHLATRSKYFGLRVYRNQIFITHLYLVILAELDREHVSSHVIEVKAFDGGGQFGSLMVYLKILDVNDCAPLFKKERYFISLYKWFPLHSLIMSVPAVDYDEGDNGRIEYSFPEDTNARVRELFSLNSENGNIVLISSLVLEQYHSYKFSVIAKDNGHAVRLSSSVLIIIEIKPPLEENLKIYASGLENRNTLEVFENQSPGFTLTSITAVPKASHHVKRVIHCQLEPSQEYFSLKRTYDNVFSLATKVSIDRESTANFVVYIACVNHADYSEGAVERFKITILDENDNYPEFVGKTTFSIHENLNSGTYVGKVLAFDKDDGENGKIRYTFLDSPNVPFAVDATSGYLTTTSSLDREYKNKWTLTAVVVDGGTGSLSSSVNITIYVLDKNDNAPQFSSTIPKIVHIPSTITSREPILIFNATDSDEGVNANCFFKLADHFHTFQLSEKGELYYIRNVTSRFVKQYLIRVLVQDNGIPPLSSKMDVSIHIHEVNKHRPKFMRDYLEINITSCLTNGSVVAKVQAYDDDEGKSSVIRYNLTGMNSSFSPFMINSVTGEIYMHLSPLITKKMYKVVVQARDLGVPSFSDSLFITFRIMKSAQKEPNFSDRHHHQEGNLLVIIVILLTSFLFFVTFFCIYHVFGVQRRETESPDVYSTYV